jgi:hypothetical protein
LARLAASLSRYLGPSTQQRWLSTGVGDGGDAALAFVACRQLGGTWVLMGGGAG